MRGSGKKRILFPLWGFQWGSLGGGVSSNSSTRWGEKGVGFFDAGCGRGFLGVAWGGGGVVSTNSSTGWRDGEGGSYKVVEGQGFLGVAWGVFRRAKNGSFSSRGGGGGGGGGFQQGRGRTGFPARACVPTSKKEKLFQRRGLADGGRRQWEEKNNFNQTHRFEENWTVRPIYRLDRRFKRSNPSSMPFQSN